MMRAPIVLAIALAAAPRADAKGCHEVSDAVGFHRCHAFGGAWSRESSAMNLRVDVGFFDHRFVAQPFSLPSSAHTTTGADDLHTIAYGAQLRMTGHGRWLYAGLEMDGSSVTTAPRYGGTQATGGGIGDWNALLGVHVIERYRIALSAELAAGVRSESFVACTSADSKCPHGSLNMTGELSARVRADLFVHPQLSLGVAYGASLVAPDDRVLAITAAFHGRVLDGRY